MNIEYNSLLITSKYMISHTSLIDNSIYAIEIIYESNSKKYIHTSCEETLCKHKYITINKTYFNNKKYYLYEYEIEINKSFLDHIPTGVLQFNIKIYTRDLSSKTNIYNINCE